MRRTVCFLVGTLVQGGAERQLYYMLRTLREQGHAVTVLCLTQGEHWESRIRDLGVPVIWVGRHDSRPLRLLRILREVQRLKPDIVQSSHFYTNLPAAIAGWIFGIPAIGAMRNDCLSEVAVTGRILGPLNLKAPRTIAGNSMLGIRNAVRLGIPPGRLFFLPNVVDCSEFGLVARPSQHTPVRILTAGRFVNQKRQDRFIRLIHRLQSATTIPVKGTLVGDGPNRQKLLAQRESLGLSEAELEMSGISTNMKKVYDEADIFVLTSDWEGTPNVVLEAMAAGVPVITTDVGDVASLVEDNVSGFVVEPGQEDDMFARVMRLVENTGERLTFATNARRRIDEKFSLHGLGERLEALYRSLPAAR